MAARPKGRPRPAAKVLPRSRRRHRAAWWLLLLPVVGIALVWVVRARNSSSRGTALHPAATMNVEQAAKVGYACYQRGRYQESLPYYRRIVDLIGTEWMAQVNYSSALHNAAQETRTHLAHPTPAVRSSVERMALVLASFRAEDLA